MVTRAVSAPPKRAPKPQRAKAFKADIGAVGVKVVVALQVYECAGAQRDVCLDLLTCPVDVLRHARHLKHRILLSTRCHNVCVSLLLDTFDRGSFRPDHQAHHTVGHTHLDSSLARKVWRPRKRTSISPGFAARRTNHGEVISCRDNLTLGHFHVLAAARHYKHRVLTSHRGLDVSVGLCSQGFDLTTYKQKNIWQQLRPKEIMAQIYEHHCAFN